MQHIVVLHFVQIQHSLDFMVFLLFYWDQHGTQQEQVFPLHHYKAWDYGKIHENNLQYLKYFFPCLAVFDLLTHLIVELTSLF